MTHAFSVRSLALAILLTTALGSVAWAKPKIAVLGFEATGAVDKQAVEVAKDLTDQMRTRAGLPSGQFQLAPNSKRELVDEKLMNGCTDEKPACMAAIGSNIGADLLVYGHVERTKRGGGDGYAITTKMLNVASKVVLESWDDFVPLDRATGPGMAELAKKGYIKLTGEKPAPDKPVPPQGAEKPTGTLVVKVGNAQRGTVFIDEDAKGQLDGGAVTVTLPEGRYKLAIEADGYRRYEQSGVEVRAGQSRDVAIALEAAAIGGVIGPRKSSNTTLKIAAGAGFVVAAAGAAMWIQAYMGPIDTYKGLNATGTKDGVTIDLTDKQCGQDFSETHGDFDEFQAACRGKTRTAIGAAMVGIGGAVGIGALVYMMVKKSPEERPTAMGGRTRKRDFVVTPVLSPDGGGATLQFDW